MSEVKVGKNETLDSALRRFKRNCQRSGVLSEVRKREHYEKPSVKRKKKSEAAGNAKDGKSQQIILTGACFYLPLQSESIEENEKEMFFK